MQLEYLDEAVDSRPAILLYGARADESAVLRAVFAELARTDGRRVSLHELPFIEPVHGCGLIAISGQRDSGVHTTAEPRTFEWTLSPGTWENVVGLVDPFCGSQGERFAFQYLNPASGLEVILSVRRSW